MEEKKKKASRSERLSVGLLLAVTGGFLDAYTYGCRGGVFANAQTGNLVLLGIHLAAGNIARAVYYLFPIAAFLAGILLVEAIKHHCSTRRFLHWKQTVLLLEIALLFAAGFVPVSVPHLLVNVTVSFICSVQVHSFRSVEGLPYASTMCTGNMRSAMEQLYLALSKKDAGAARAVGVYSAVVGIFCLGAGVGALLTGLLGSRAVWLCCVPLLATCLLLQPGVLDSAT
ncbi:MAG: YoaK family protein [Pygmaiobacter sp.]